MTKSRKQRHLKQHNQEPEPVLYRLFVDFPNRSQVSPQKVGTKAGTKSKDTLINVLLFQ